MDPGRGTKRRLEIEQSKEKGGKKDKADPAWEHWEALSEGDGSSSSDEEPEYNDGYDENLNGDEADRARLAAMTVRDREQEFFRRLEHRDMRKRCSEIEKERNSIIKKKSWKEEGAGLSSLQKKLREVLASETGKDFVLISNNGAERGVHKAILAASSPFFQAMFDSGMEENKSGRCKLPDVTTKILNILVPFMYYECTGKVGNHVHEVFVLADKYQMEDLKEVCVDILVGRINKETAVETLLLAEQFSARRLNNAALTYIIGDFREIIKAGHL